MFILLLQGPEIKLGRFVELPFFFRYGDTLIQQRGETFAKGQEFLTWNDVQKCIDTVNVQVHEEHERKMTFLALAE